MAGRWNFGQYNNSMEFERFEKMKKLIADVDTIDGDNGDDTQFSEGLYDGSAIGV